MPAAIERPLEDCVCWPDGLEQVAAKLGFEHHAATTALVSTPFHDYQLPWFGDSGWATAAVGALGTLVAFAFAWFLARTLVAKTKT